MQSRTPTLWILRRSGQAGSRRTLDNRALLPESRKRVPTKGAVPPGERRRSGHEVIPCGAVWVILASASLVVAWGCGNSYDIRLNKTLEDMKYRKRLDEMLMPPLTKNKFEELLIFVRPPKKLELAKEFLLPLPEPGKFDLEASLLDTGKAGDSPTPGDQPPPGPKRRSPPRRRNRACTSSRGSSGPRTPPPRRKSWSRPIAASSPPTSSPS